MGERLKVEKRRAERGGSRTGKQLMYDYVMTLRAAGATLSDAELSEAKALESVGVRRRRRW